MDVDDEISNLVDLHMGMFGGWKWQDLQGLLWLDHHKKKMCVKGVSNGEKELGIYRLKFYCSPVPPVLLKKGTGSHRQEHRPTIKYHNICTNNDIPDIPNMCDNDIPTDQNAEECDDERVALANLIATLKLDVDENKKIQKQLKKANTSLAHELKECKFILAETSRTLGESNSIWDNFLIAIQNTQTELETYKTLNDRTVDYDKLERKLNETLGLLAQKEIDIKEGLKLKAYEILVVKEKHDELVKQIFLTKSHYEGLVKEKTNVITDLTLKEEKDIDKMILMEKQLKFLNKIVYKRNQSIQTIHMIAPKGSTFNDRPTFANPMYLKKAQSEKPCLYEIPYDISDPANRFIPDKEETLTLKKEGRSKLNKNLAKPYDYAKQNSLYEIFKPVSQEYHEQLAHANEQGKKTTTDRGIFYDWAVWNWHGYAVSSLMDMAYWSLE
ncbi:hypothetical protein Tco_1438138 [Tanacetum coccineum]